MNKIAVVTSGGDAPGLNAALHTIVVTANARGLQLTGVNDGYEGLIDGRFCTLDLQSVRNVMDRGGTILHTSRSNRFLEKEYRVKALAQLKRQEIDGLIILGGNGSLKGAAVFEEETNFPLVVIPKTIDNDVFGTDYAIGYDTAANTVVDAIEKIRDTADATSRIFVIEVMGRNTGYLALAGGIATAAQAIIIPEIPYNIDKLMDCISYSHRIGNRSMLIVVTEHTIPGGSGELVKKINTSFPESGCHLSVLGHIQRGGSPSAFDRMLATQLGYHATIALAGNHSGIMYAVKNGKVACEKIADVADKYQKIDPGLLKIAGELSILI